MEVQNNNSMFKPSLKRLETMLTDMHPQIQRIERFNNAFDRPREIEGLKELLQEGEELILKCSRIKRYNCFKKSSYNKRILKLEEEIRNYISVTLQVQQLADHKEILYEFKTKSLNCGQLSNQSSFFSTDSTGSSVVSNKSELVDVCAPPKLNVNPIGLKIPLSDLKLKLLKDDRVSLIVLSAPGGCGKTTLAKALCQDKEVQDKFQGNIFFVNVSKAFNPLVIVEKLFQHNNCEFPAVQSEEEAINQLERLFRQIEPNPLLLILDDVWAGSESFLDKLKFDIENYKILVTSRFQFPRFGSTYKLQTLNFTDAMTLFQQSAFLPDENSYKPGPEIVEKIVERCKGYPLAITVTGRSLCGQPAVEWRKRSKELSKPAAILSDSELLNCLQSSLDALNNDTMKECFMDLGSFPEDQKIPAATLIDIWVELHNLDEDDASINLYELSCRNLLELFTIRKNVSEDDGCYNEHFVRQHDLLRELAILQTNTGRIEHRTRLFVEIYGNKFPEWWIKPEHLRAPDLETLMLNFQTKNFTLPEFMERMDKLKALIVNNFGSLPAELSNFALLGSLSNLKRIRLEKVSVPHFFLTSIKLEKLEKMSLVMCNVGRAFTNSAVKISDAFPNLVEINIDYCNDLVKLPAGFCDLILLKRLSITNCHKLYTLPEEVGKLINLEVLTLNSCIELLELPRTVTRLHKLKVLDLSYCLSITELPENIGELYSLRKLGMIECSSCDLPSSVKKLVHLEEVIGDEEVANAWKRFKPHLPYLRIKVHKENNLNWLRSIPPNGLANQKHNTMFMPSLKRLENMLTDMHPHIQRIEAFNIAFDRPREIDGLKELLQQGQYLVDKCSRINILSYYKRPIYNKKILKLEESIRKFITTTMQVQQAADNKEILFEVKGNSLKLTQLSNQFSNSSMDSTDVSVISSSKSELLGVCTPSKPAVNPVGLEIPLRDLKIKLLNDSQVSWIVISAPGGCGKTTLAKTLCQDPEVKGKFNGNIFFVNVSKAPNLLVIVEKLFQHMNYKLPIFQSEEEAVDQLEHLLRQLEPNPILLVLDDVWPGSESEYLLGRLKFDIKDYRIVVTSRSELRRFGTAYKLQTLNFKDAMTLFNQSAFLPDGGNSYIPDPEIVKKIVQSCKGFPLAISVTGKSLRGKPAVEWRKRLKQWSKTAALLSEFELLKCLQSSVDALEDQVVKECYLDLGSFPEDQKIPAATLIDMWVELYDLDEDDAFFVTQHDLLRELAILQSNSGSIQDKKRAFVDITRNKFPKGWTESEKLLISARLLSICTDETFASKWYSMQAPDLEVLILNFQTNKYALPEFMETMDKLKVLVLNNHGFLPAELSNSPVLGSLSNLKRIRLEKVFIPSILTSLKLDKLEKMTLVMCFIGQAFSNSANNISHAFPNLSEINMDYCNDLVELPAGLCHLVSLKKLRITNCHKLCTLPEEIGNLRNLELLELPPAVVRLQKLKILDLSDCLSLTKLPEQIGELHSLRKLYMIGCESIDFRLPSSVVKLTHLEEVIGDEETVNSWNHLKHRFPCLNVKIHRQEINLNWLQ
ncbi:hypothetical protein Tsubulata_017839 [Turnera subulata]|uniref:RPW8 domain-containing protein n=1 Tax=Turnera subulata TaxID=218843 RepID=A0A9Q0FDK1_9ROSI|nr:hypothetical protein Tsubulata_017839 [Turnera subulata]